MPHLDNTARPVAKVQHIVLPRRNGAFRLQNHRLAVSRRNPQRIALHRRPRQTAQPAPTVFLHRLHKRPAHPVRRFHRTPQYKILHRIGQNARQSRRQPLLKQNPHHNLANNTALPKRAPSRYGDSKSATSRIRPDTALADGENDRLTLTLSARTVSANKPDCVSAYNSPSCAIRANSKAAAFTPSGTTSNGFKACRDSHRFAIIAARSPSAPAGSTADTSAAETNTLITAAVLFQTAFHGLRVGRILITLRLEHRVDNPIPRRQQSRATLL
ncbi:hypothetical protein ACLD9W_06440 [Neisseria sp. WLZKY-1]|uniref:hypothetical protein n=1 Tax=Neisseria sp. WLZKY-1 TaxID=3390377 RepID=UPI00397E5E25